MSWRTIISRAEKLLGGHAPFVDLSLLGKSEATALVERVRSLAAVSDHPFVPVLQAHLENTPYDISLPKLSSIFSSKKSTAKFPDSLLIPLIGQIGVKNSADSLKLHRKIGEIYASVDLALGLHR